MSCLGTPFVAGGMVRMYDTMARTSSSAMWPRANAMKPGTMLFAIAVNESHWHHRPTRVFAELADKHLARVAGADDQNPTPTAQKPWSCLTDGPESEP